jgi:uracil-DNA glycosylase
VDSVAYILALGVYLTTAVKYSRMGCGLRAATIKACSLVLEQELALCPDRQVLMLTGDVAIQHE